MQEEVENKSINLAVSSSRLAFREIANELNRYLRNREALKVKKKTEKTAQKQMPKSGKQSVKQLIKQNQGVSNLEIERSGIKEFEKYARKYGVDYAVKKDISTVPPKFLVFFKARDADALTAAFKEYSTNALRKSTRPSVLKQLSSLVAKVASIPRKIRNKEQEHNL